MCTSAILRSSAQPSGGRIAEKNEVRLQIHEQLKVLWSQHPSLRNWALGDQIMIKILADAHAKCGMQFVPLVNSRFGLACALDILFLRRDPPGSAIITGGDIDNRLKLLLDGLKVPKDCTQLPSNWRPRDDQNPLFCLMEDDNLITEIKVTTDRLLAPMAVDEGRNDVMLLIHVTTKVINHDRAYVEFM